MTTTTQESSGVPAPQYRRLDRREAAAAHGVRSGDPLATLPNWERVTRAHEDLLARAWGITLPPAPASLEAPRSNGPQIRDWPGRITIAEMKPLFEDTMRAFRGLSTRVSLDPAYLDGETGYYNTDTNLMWIGFALGMRCAERIAKEAEA